MSADTLGPLPSGTVTFLFTDVEGSTRLWATDKDLMSASLLVRDAILRAAIEGNGGYAFTTAGDSFAAAFAKASDAVRAATKSQRALTDATWPGPTLRVRMGLHLGEAEERGGDYFGPVVNTAARVEAAGHGGQVLVTEPVRIAAGVTDVSDLGVRSLRDVAEPMRLFQLGTETFSALRVVDPSMSNLPVRPTRMIGREAEVARVRGLLTEARLVTVTAVGGSGKTRLAVAVGEAELPHCRSGVWFVDLTAVSTGEEVPSAIANGLGLNLMTGDATAQIFAFLADKQALVILDNCEHVIDEAASFVEAFLATSNPTKILATSREAFDVDGERTVVLGSLPTDTADSPGVRLFVDRATALEPSFALTEANTSTVSAICGRLDGMPLAIELAAARITVMNPDELLAGLDDRFQLLSGGRRRSRQRTLEATLDWSYDLLDAEEQRVFRALGVFVDGFDLDAVAAVTGLDRRVATQHIETLRAKSLVVRADKRKATRFRLLETVKAYAEDRLVDAGEAEQVRDRHLAHFHSAAMAEGLKVVGSLDVGLRLREDCSNITTAFEWAADHEQWTLAGELLAASQCAYHLNGRDVDLARALVRTTAHTAELDPDLHGCLLAQTLYSGVVLADFGLLSALGDLRRSPMSEFRSIGWAMTGFISTWVEPGSATEALDRAEAELGTPSQPDILRSNAAALARSFPLMTRAVDSFFNGNFESARALSHELIQSFARTTSMTEWVLQHSLASVLLGQARVALSTLAQLDDLDLPYNDGNDVRALAYLALGDNEAAHGAARRFVTRAAAGVLPAESNDAMLVLASFARHEGDDDDARSFLLSVGTARLPSTRGMARHLASQLGILKVYEADVATIYQPDNPHGPMGATRSLNALRAELARRGWD